ncbi:hypothetical protein BUALT_Bualt04G0037800 [Buddleja alternifolia]|uniref:Beta-glucosidase n=1 Tax=Buddleja alternifolia TaxID=168488 RepID=A0AAV6XN39_9LAMI|nr:hypothetical protein BUALT_Bualt04G0037800 [Buddleja alternifolia]
MSHGPFVLMDIYAGGIFPLSTTPITPALASALISSEDFCPASITADLNIAISQTNLVSAFSSTRRTNNHTPSGNSFVPYRACYDADVLLSAHQSISTSNSSNGNNTRSMKPNHANDELLAHAEAVNLYRTQFKGHPEGKIGITLVSHWFVPLNEQGERDQEAAQRALDFMLGWFLDPIMRADDPNPEVEDGYYKDQQVKIHFKRNGVAIGPQAGSDWLYVVPRGIRKLLHYVNNTYKCDRLLPIYITENAREACVDPMRVKYYQDHLANIRRAMREGVDVKGYFAWTWCDNFEWNIGYDVRFGLMYVDFMNGLTRYPKQSAMWFTKFLTRKNSCIDPKKRNIMKLTAPAGNEDVEDDDEAEKRLKTTE